MKKRNITSPSINFEEQEGFFMLSNQDVAIAIHNKLTGTQMRLWLYLNTLDPFADSTKSGEKIFKEIPSPQEIAITLGASPETIIKDMRMLKKLELYDYRITQWRGYNHSAKKAKLEAKRKKNKPQTQTEHNLGLNNLSQGLNNPPYELNNLSQGLNNLSESPKPPSDIASKSPQTITDYSNYLYVSNTNTQFFDNEVEIQLSEDDFEISSEEQEEIQEAITESLLINDDPIFRDCSIPETNRGQIEELESIEDKGIDGFNFNYGELGKNKDFQEWLARKWKAKYPDITSMHEAIANVKAYFINQPEKIMIRWEEYQAEKKQRIDAQDLLLNNYNNNSVNIYSDQYGRSVKVNDYTGYHQKLEEEKPNPKVAQMMKDFLANFQGGRR